MAPPTAPPAGKAAKKKRLIIMGAAGVALLLFLYMRSQSGGSSSTAAQTNATNAADTQQAIDNAVAQQQAQDASTYGYGAYGAGGGVDTSGIESGLSTIDTDLQNLPSAIAAQGGVQSAGAVPPPSTSPTTTPPITVNINGQPAGAGGTRGVRLSTRTPKGDLAAPFGHRKPTAPKGYHAVGLGHGNWAFAPIRPTGHHNRHRRRH